MAEVEDDRRPGAKSGARRFDPGTFLATTAKGRAISTHRKGDKFFAQGDAADAIFYIKKARSKLP
jgi:CRP/FNR family transcriptional regulator, cyclic AMP receptor protein